MLERNHLDWPKELISPQDGRLLLGRLFIYSYGFSATLAGIVFFTGVGSLDSLLVFWLGGIATVLAIGLILARPKRAIVSPELQATPVEQSQDAQLQP